MRELAPWIRHYHLKNVAGRERLGVFAPDNVYSPSGTRVGMVLLGEGSIDYSAILAEMNKGSFGAAASLEWFGDEPFDYLNREMRWLKEMERDAAGGSARQGEWRHG